MTPSKAAFLRFWGTDHTRQTFLSHLGQDDLAALRLVCRDFGTRTAPALFGEMTTTFRTCTFTKQSRLAALGRVGHHVKTLSFNMPHTEETFLPPLIDPATGEHVPFIYQPCVQKDPNQRRSGPSYGSWEVTDLLIKQYPPLFHAAANIPSFIKALSNFPNLRQLQISCPGQDPAQQYRRSTVDHALISLRIALERNKLPSLNSLRLQDVHPAAAFYLNPEKGFGSSPASMRRWKQIRKLDISMDSISSPADSHTDHLKHLHSYLNIFTRSVRKIEFKWQGEPCPCPTTLNAETSLREPTTPSACPSTCRSAPKALRFSRLRQVGMSNTVADASQIARFIARHHRAVRHTKRLNLDFENTTLRSGTWDEALEPLTQISGSDSWKCSSSSSGGEDSIDGSACPRAADEEEAGSEFMDVPIMFSPVDIKQEQVRSMWTQHCQSEPHRSRTCNKGMAGLQKVSVRTKELLFGTEEHMRRLFGLPRFGIR